MIDSFIVLTSFCVAVKRHQFKGSLIQYEGQQVFTNDYFEELVDKYSLPSRELEQLNLNQKLEEVRNFLKNEIYKQYKLQEGAEKMRIATTDKKGLNNLNLVIKESNMKIAALNEELQDLNSFIVITQSETSVFDSYNSELSAQLSVSVLVEQLLNSFSCVSR